jgi:hypothetical protein
MNVNIILIFTFYKKCNFNRVIKNRLVLYYNERNNNKVKKKSRVSIIIIFCALISWTIESCIQWFICKELYCISRSSRGIQHEKHGHLLQEESKRDRGWVYSRI